MYRRNAVILLGNKISRKYIYCLSLSDKSSDLLQLLKSSLLVLWVRIEEGNAYMASLYIIEQNLQNLFSHWNNAMNITNHFHNRSTNLIKNVMSTNLMSFQIPKMFPCLFYGTKPIIIYYAFVQ